MYVIRLAPKRRFERAFPPQKITLEELQQFLGERDIATGLHYPLPLHLQKAYEHLGYKEGDFPVAERAAKRLLSLPMYPELTRDQIKYVADSVKEFMKR